MTTPFTILFRALFCLVFYAASAQAATVASEDDLCAPCNNGAHCDSGYCVQDTNGTGFCSQACAALVGCPQGYTCTAFSGSPNVCVPSRGQCPSNYVAPLNAQCRWPTDSNGQSFERNCDSSADLTCFVFASGIGACVTACSSLQGGTSCPFGQTCCFGTDATGDHCLVTSSSQSLGGCFLVQGAGNSCVLANTALCTADSVCMAPANVAQSRCFKLCAAASDCGASGSCQSVNGNNVCCDATTLNANDLTTCLPEVSVCKRQVGVVCSQNDDCALGLCYKNQSQSACTTVCSTDADCPGVNDDVNGDGVPDGGSTCKNFSGTSYCWPTRGPAAAPACALALPETQPPVSSCGCHNAQASAPGLAALASAMMWRRRQRRHRRQRAAG